MSSLGDYFHTNDDDKQKDDFCDGDNGDNGDDGDDCDDGDDGDEGDDDAPEELGGVRSGSTSCLFQLPIILALGRSYF